MKFIFSQLFFTYIAAAAPALAPPESAESGAILAARLAAADVAAANTRGMKWTGAIFPGAENTTLYGHAKDILEQIHKINPNYDPAFSLPQSLLEHRELAARSIDGGNCGTHNFGTAAWGDSQTNVNYVTGLGGSCSVGPNTCIRMACSGDSGLYLCNGNTYPISPSCSYMGNSYAKNILQRCIDFGESGSGQKFDTDRYNVVIAYSNCGASPNIIPSNYPYPGPNGPPSEQCMSCLQVGQ